MNDKTTKKILRENMRKMKWLVTFFICEKGHNWLWNGTYILCFFLKKITTSGKIFHDRWSQHISPLLTGWLRISGENLNKKMFKKWGQVARWVSGQVEKAELQTQGLFLLQQIYSATQYSPLLFLPLFDSILLFSTPISHFLPFSTMPYSILPYYTSYAPLLYFCTLSCANTLCLILLFYLTKKKGKS